MADSRSTDNVFSQSRSSWPICKHLISSVFTDLVGNLGLFQYIDLLIILVYLVDWENLTTLSTILAPGGKVTALI